MNGNSDDDDDVCSDDLFMSLRFLIGWVEGQSTEVNGAKSKIKKRYKNQGRWWFWDLTANSDGNVDRALMEMIQML